MKKCCVCDSIIEKHLPIEEKYLENAKKTSLNADHVIKSETFNGEEYECPKCYALDRDRLVVLFLKKLFKEILQEKGTVCKIKILDIAPSAPVGKWIKRNLGFCEYVTADLYMTNVDYNVDIQNMECFEDATFDIVICCHVLEHIHDDLKAMSEICRVMKEDGIGILLVPLDLNQKVIDEAYNLSKEENVKRFGQEDHVRKYCKDGFLDRLGQAGFRVQQYRKPKLYKKEWESNALTDTSTLYLGVKDSGNIYKMFWNTRNIIWFSKIEDFLPVEVRNAGGGYNCWIDSLTVKDNILNLWGWFYFEEKISSKSKLKLLIKNDKIFDIKEFDWRVRQDIEDNFNVSRDGRLLNSGIDIQLDLNSMEKGIYDLQLLILNEKEYALIQLESFTLE